MIPIALDAVALPVAVAGRWRRDGDDVAALTDALLHANGWLA